MEFAFLLNVPGIELNWTELENAKAKDKKQEKSTLRVNIFMAFPGTKIIMNHIRVFITVIDFKNALLYPGL